MPAVRKNSARKIAVAAASSEATPVRTLVPDTPEAKKTGGNKRKRLSKAFSRPLDKELRQEQVVRDRFTLPEIEYARLVELKKYLSDQGVDVKKSQLVRAGLLLLSELADDALKGLLEKVPSVD